MATLLVDGFEDFEGRADAFAFLVEYEGAVFHAASGEEADIPVAGEFLGRMAGRGVVLGWDGGEGGRTDCVKMVGYQGFIGDEEEEGELFEYRDLGHPNSRDGLVIELVLVVRLVVRIMRYVDLLLSNHEGCCTGSCIRHNPSPRQALGYPSVG